MSWQREKSLNDVKSLDQALQLLGKNQEIRIKRIYHVVSEQRPKVEPIPEPSPKPVHKIVPVPIRKKIIPVIFKKQKPEIKLTPKLVMPESESIIKPIIPQPVQPFYQPVTQIVEQPSYVQQVQQTVPIVAQVPPPIQQIQHTAFHQAIPVVTQNMSASIPQQTQLRLTPMLRAPNPLVYHSTN